MPVGRRIIDAVRRANQSREPEHSIRLRVAASGTVLAAIVACGGEGEISWPLVLAAVALVLIGMGVSYVTRVHPPWWIKVGVAVAAVAALVRFLLAVVNPAGGLAVVEQPLTVLLVSILVVHSFHVPSRRDLLFSLGASAGLMAVGAAQAITPVFGLYVLIWAAFGVWGLTEMWRSASEGARLSVFGLVAALTGAVAASSVAFLLLPSPVVSSRLGFLSHAGLGGSIGADGALAGDGGSPVQLAHAGSASDPTRVGGYLGFADTLNTALRGNLGQTLVMYVRSQLPSYWVGETFDTWNGQSWTQAGNSTRPVDQQSPIVLSVPAGDSPFGQSDLQTFYVETSTADLVFHAEAASELWFPASKVFESADGTIVSSIGLGRGSIYSVDSEVDTATPAQLRHAFGGIALTPEVMRDDLQLPQPYPRVKALAESITSGATTTYDKVEALITWIGHHTHYSTDIPPFPPGADTVDEFLFGNRVGYCEQISTSLTVMLRSLGIDSREAVGYVPGSYNPLTDLYEVRADDAHAWVQVWFPGYGWQSFDPTAVVPDANPSPGGTALHDIGAALGRIPPVPVAATLFGLLVASLLLRWRQLRRTTWVEQAVRRADRAGRRLGRKRSAAETFLDYADALDALSGGAMPAVWHPLAVAAEAVAYGGPTPSGEVRRQLLKAARPVRPRLHPARKRRPI